MVLGVTEARGWGGGKEWALSYVVPASELPSPRPSSPSPSQRHLFGPYSSHLGHSGKAEAGPKENINIQADETLSAAQ